MLKDPRSRKKRFLVLKARFSPRSSSARLPRVCLLGVASAALLLLSSQARAASIVAPNSLADTEGNAANDAPFNRNAFFTPSSQRYQQVFAASQFSLLPPAGGLITQISFRPDSEFGSSFFTTLTDIRIDLSTTAAAPDALSLTFASNVGLDDAIVFGGPSGAPLTLSSANTGSSGGPKAFDIVINLTTAFFYDPTLGNLLLDVRNFSGGTTTSFDAVEVTGDSVSRVSTAGSGVNSPTADQKDTIGLVTSFTTTAVPEPSTWLLLTGGLGVLAAVVRKADQKRG